MCIRDRVILRPVIETEPVDEHSYSGDTDIYTNCHVSDKRFGVDNGDIARYDMVNVE